MNYPQLIQESRINNIPLEAFISDYYESAGALIIPFSRYGAFLKMLLKQGSIVKLKLLIYLIVKKKDCML